MGALLVIQGCSTPPPPDPVAGIVVVLGKDVNLDLVLIPAGRFMMGFTEKELGELKEWRTNNIKEQKEEARNFIDILIEIILGKKQEPLGKTGPDEVDEFIREYGKQHEVTITKPFYMGKFEVTQEQWESVMGNNPSETKGVKLPVTDVSWEDCQDFIKKLNTKTDGGYRLPTEAEWEYACRAGTTTKYSFGDKITRKDANYRNLTVETNPVAVGSYKPNAFGLYDMHGNASEWCEDWHGNYPSESVTDPKGSESGECRVVRGGCWWRPGSFVRSSFRDRLQPSSQFLGFGFRLARMADFKVGVSPTSPKPDPVNLLLAPFTETQAKEIQKVIAKSFQKEVEEKADLGKGINLDLVLIPAGKFMMGSPESEKGQSNYVSQYEAMISKPFYMGKYEVTQDQWDAVMNSNPSNKKGVNLPVTNLSWGDSQEFIKKLNAKSSGGYRLPTEAEWEYACRAGTNTAYSFGDRITKSDANIGGGSRKEVGSYKPNAFGLYDMHGNVSEWCEDRYGVYPKGTVTDPKGPATEKYRVLRGGSFLNNGWVASSFNRAFSSSPSRSDSVGFRLARTADIAPTVIKPDPSVIIPVTGNLLVAPFTEAKAKEVQIVVAKILQKEVEEKADLGKGINLDLVLIPAGKFKMGSPINEMRRYDEEKQHEVTLTQPFYMGKYEVTQEQWKSVMGNNPSNTKGEKLPVTDVSWEDCQDFIKKLNGRTNRGYRLPTEAEWEYACRAGTNTAYSFGDRITNSDANFTDKSTNDVGGYKPNKFGLYDMHGNVREWCEDWYGDYPEGATTDPKGPGTGTCRVIRGGSFCSFEWGVRSACRQVLSPNDRMADGFRLARTP